MATTTNCPAGQRHLCGSWSRQHPPSWPIVTSILLLLMATSGLGDNQTQAIMRRLKASDVPAPPMPNKSNQETLKTGASVAPITRHPNDDPMEPCYLSNNRASESLTISESTPVGTVVGELMVNGDSSRNGNIELSIKMPSGNYHHHHHHHQQQHSTSANDSVVRENDQRFVAGTHGKHKSSTGYPNVSTSLESSFLSRGIGPTTSVTLPLVEDPHIPSDVKPSDGSRSSSFPLSDPRMLTRDLGNIIDLMPPLTIEEDTKKLILAKKLDRENLDRYISAGGYQASYSFGGSSFAGSHRQGASASLTVHIKCQLRERPVASTANLNQSTPSTAINTTGFSPTLSLEAGNKVPKYHNQNSILIPIHLIVTDENDNWPTFIGSPYIIDLNESAPIGSLLQGNEIVAIDNDQQGPLSTIEYSIVLGSYWSDAFAFLNPLDSRSLVVKSNKFFDFESQPKLTLKVMASDQGDPPNWAISSLHINLIDQDDRNPFFGEDKYAGVIKENRPAEIIDLEPKQMIARDGDKTINGPVIYSFHRRTNHSIHFDLDSDLGRLSLKKKLPEPSTQMGQQFCLLIRATQVDNPRRWTLTMVNMRFSSGLLGTNQHLIRFNGPSSSSLEIATNSSMFKFPQSKYIVEASESAAIGSSIFTVQVNYNNQGRTNNTGIMYQLLDNEHGYLNIDENSGHLTLNKSLDFEMHREISIRVLATYEQQDAGYANKSRSSSNNVIALSYPSLFCDITRVTINVINYNEFAPEFSHDQYNFQISVSDLIANFEPSSKSSRSEGDADYDGRELPTTAARRLIRRVGEDNNLDQFRDDEGPSYEELGYKALQLGQVFCSDRDHGDKITLDLLGSKAGIFHLSQDGKLYLPLVNVSSLPAQISSNSDSTSPGRRNINNQFIMNRLFAASRRSDLSQQSSAYLSEPLDRNYLNYLLSEMSNLGRLRLKVLARDDSYPESKQSTALIVITIISIDNFILHKSSHLPSDQRQSNKSSADPNDSSYMKTGHYVTIQETNTLGQQSASSESNNSGQVMMIPSGNGRNFVQVQSDIITNLLQSSAPNSQLIQDFNNSKSNQTELLDSTTSNSMINQLIVGSNNVSENLNQVPRDSRSPHPPSLLLVDEDGAKFVAMQAAIAVYNQQVHKAGQQAQLNLLKKQSIQHDDKRLRTNSIWQLWKEQFGLGADVGPNGGQTHHQKTASNSLYWVHFSTILLIHVVLLAVIVTLVSRIFRSSFGGYRSSNCSEDSDSSGTGLWPRVFPKLTLTKPHHANEGSNGVGQVHQNCSNLRSLSSHFVNASDNLPFERPSEPESRRYAFSHHYLQASASGFGPSNKDYNSPQVGNHQHQPSTKRIDYSNDFDSRQKQNLLHNIKSTLGSILYLGRDQTNSNDCIGQVTVKPLDSEQEFSNHVSGNNDLTSPRNFNATNNIELGETSNSLQQSISSYPSPHNVTHSSKPISTFVGNWQAPKSLLVKQMRDPTATSGSLARATVVSINVTVPRPSAISPTKTTPEQLASSSIVQQSTSSSSSIVSFVSMSSSISNTISAAVDQRNSNRQCNSHPSTSSDISSLDSSTLFNRAVNSSERSASNIINHANASQKSTNQPPVPPPLPPPPSLVQVAGLNCPMQSPSSIKHQNPTQETNSQQQSRLEISESSRDFLLDSKVIDRNNVPRNPVLIKLKQEAKSEQTLYNAGDALATLATPRTLNHIGRQSAGRHNLNPRFSQTQPATSTGGRREARQQKAAVMKQQRALPPTPPPMPSMTKNPQPPLPPASGLSVETVSPTISVDRGYESFQSHCSVSQTQVSRNTAKLHKPFCNAYVTTRIPSNRGTTNHEHQRADESTMPSLASTKLPIHCETSEDSEDLYYCCDNLVENLNHCTNQIVLDSQNSIGDSDNCKDHHRFNETPGDLLSDYANHTYWHQNSSVKKTKPARVTIHQHQPELIRSHQSPVESRASFNASHRFKSTANNYDAPRNDHGEFQYPNELRNMSWSSNGQVSRQLSKRNNNHGFGSRNNQRTLFPQQNNSGNKKQLTWSDQIEITS